MKAHKFQVGQTVRYAKKTLAGGFGQTPTGYFRVVRLLPEANGSTQYRVESTEDGHQRVAMETEISK